MLSIFYSSNLGIVLNDDRNSRILPQTVPEKAYEAKAMAEQGVAMAKDKCKVQ